MKRFAYLTLVAAVFAVLGPQVSAQRNRAGCPPVPLCTSAQMLFCPQGMKDPRCGCVNWTCIEKKVPLDLKLPSQGTPKIEDIQTPPPPKFVAPPIPPSVLKPNQPDPPKLTPGQPGDGTQAK